MEAHVFVKKERRPEKGKKKEQMPASKRSEEKGAKGALRLRRSMKSCGSHFVKRGRPRKKEGSRKKRSRGAEEHL